MADYSTPLQMSPEQVRQWWARIDLARARRRPKLDEAKKRLEAYLPPKGDSGAINTNVHFRNTELKKAQMFFQVPDLQLTPSPALIGAPAIDPQTGQPAIDPQTQQPQPLNAYAAVAAKRQLLNVLLGRRYANVTHAMDQALFDVLQVDGKGCTEIHYVCEQPMIPMDQPTGEMQPQPGAVLGLGAQTAVTEPQMVPGPPVSEEWRFEYFPVSKLLKPHDWMSTEYDRAPWLGREFSVSLAVAKRRGWVPDGFTATATHAEHVLNTDARDSDKGTTDTVTGIKIWLRAAEFDEQVVNSQQFRLLILIDNQKDRVGEYRESPYQDIVPGGALGPHSMLGNPIHVWTLRDLTESSDPPPDAAFTDPLVKQKNVKRSQDIKLRDANLPRFVHPDSVTEALDKLKSADVGMGVGVNDDLLARFPNLIVPLPKLEHATSDRELEQAIDRDVEETLAIGSNQAGGFTDGVRSATETAIVDKNVSVRMRKERNRWLDLFLIAVEKFDSLTVRYGDVENLTPLVGPQNAQLLMVFKASNGKALFDAKPDSQLSLDASEQRKTVQEYVNFMAKSQFVDQKEMAELVTSEFGYDTTRLVKDPQPQGPPPPNVSVKVDIADLAGPAGGAALKILQQAGYQLNETDLATAQANGLIVAQQEAAQQQVKTAHGGAADQAEKVSKHHSELTGNMDGRAPQGVPVPTTPMGPH